MCSNRVMLWRNVLVAEHRRCLTRFGGAGADDVENGASVAAAAEVAGAQTGGRVDGVAPRQHAGPLSQAFR